MPEYEAAEPIAAISGTKSATSVESGSQLSSTSGDGTTSSTAEGIYDTADLSAQAQEQLSQMDQDSQTKAVSSEQETQQNEAMQQVKVKVEQMNALLAKGDIAGAKAIMQEISSLTGTSEIEMPQQTSDGQTSGNVSGIYGDAPSFTPSLLPTDSSSSSSSSGSSSVDMTGVRATLPGDGNQGVVNTALDIASKGYPYVWGGNGAQSGGYDCSGFTKAVYAQNGINIPRTAQTQYDYCKKQGTLFTDIKSAKAGDLIFFDNPYSKKTTPVGHVMIYLGNGKMVGAQSDGVKVYSVASMSKYIVGYGRPTN